MSSSCPWDQLPGESALWYGRFLDYLHANKPRSFLAVYNVFRVGQGRKKSHCVSRSWNDIFDKFHWQERCDAFDAAEAERVKQEHRERIELQRQRELRASDLMYAKAEAMLDLPHVKETMDVDGSSVTVIPEFKAFDTARGLMAESKSQARGALEMTEKKHSLELDLSKLPADALSGLLIATFSEESDAGKDSSGDDSPQDSPPEGNQG